jgi:hypothetical protein
VRDVFLNSVNCDEAITDDIQVTYKTMQVVEEHDRAIVCAA